MTKDLSLTVPFSPAMVLGPSIINGDLIASLSASDLARGWRRTFKSSISNNGDSSNNTGSELGGRPGRDGREGPDLID